MGCSFGGCQYSELGQTCRSAYDQRSFASSYTVWPTIYQRLLQEAQWREYDCQKSFDDWQVSFYFDIFLIDRESGKFFDALQEQGSRDEYGTVLGRLVCFYVRLLSLQDEIEPDERKTWYEAHRLKTTQVNKLHRLIELLNCNSETISDSDWDEAFHETIKELFCWTESKKLLEEVDCPVQRFLMVACLRHEGYHWTLLRGPPRAEVPSIILCVKRRDLPAPQRGGSSHSGEGKNGRSQLIKL